MKVEIAFSKSSMKFISKNRQLVTKEKVFSLIVKALKVLLKKEKSNIDLKRLKGTKDEIYRIRTGNIRIIFSYINGEIVIATINKIDFRGGVYK